LNPSKEAGEQGSQTVKGMYHLFLGNTAYTFLLAVTAIVVGRILGPDGYGLYAVALIVPSFLFTAIRLGLDSAATRYAARLRSEGMDQEAVSFVYATMVFGVVIATVSSLVFVGLSGWIATSVVDRPELGAAIIPVAMISVIGQAAFNITDLAMTGLGKFDRAGLLQALQGAIKLVVSVALVGIGYGVGGAVAGYTVAYVVSGMLGIVYVLWLARGSRPKGMRIDFETGLRYGFPIYVSSLAGGLVTPVISIALARTVSNSQIGGYSQAGTFISLILLLTYPISTGLFPLFSRKVDDYRVLAGTYQTSLRYTALLVTPVTGFIIAFSGPMMETVYGSSYAFASPYLSLFAVTSLLAGLGSLAWSPLLNGIGRTRDVLWTTALGSAFSMACGVGLIEAFGVSGAIVGPIVGAAVSLAVGTWLVDRRLESRLAVSKMWKFYAASGLAAALSWPVSWLLDIPELALLGGAVVFVVLFVPLLALLSALSEADIEELRGYLMFSAVISKPFDLAVSYYKLALGIFHTAR